MIPPDLHSQMLRMLDGELSAGELAALEAELETNPEARKSWQRLSRLHSALEVRYESLANIEKMPVVPIDRVLARQRRRVVRISVLAAAAVVLVSAVALWMNSIPQRPATIAGFQPAPNSVFTLSHSGDAEAPVGNVLAEGSRLTLEHGVVELGLPHDVRALVEAPATMTLTDARTLQLDHGRAFFRVDSAEGKGFTVVTPHQRIVDLGTAFGIDARTDRSEVELHIFEGMVRVDSLDGKQGDIIASNRSVLLAGARVDRELDGPPTAFRQKLPAKVETVLLEDFESGLLGGRDYAVRIDPTAIRDLAGNRFAGISDDESWNFSTAVPATVPIPVASYMYDGANPPTDQPSDHQPSTSPPGLFLDPGNTKLTDGNPGDSDGWTSGTYVGFEDPADVSNPQVTFDLGAIHQVQTITVMLHTMTSNTPESVLLSVSTDGVDYSAPANLVPRFSGSGLVTATLDISTRFPARYYRLGFVNSTEWTFLGEVQFAAASAPSRDDDWRAPAGDKSAREKVHVLSDRDDSPPAIMALYPADEASDAAPGGQLTMVFNEPIKMGTGRIFLRNTSDWSESEIAVGGPRTSTNGRFLTITPPANLPDGERSVGRISGWVSDAWVGLVNPRGDGTWYTDGDLKDKGRGRGTIGSMRGPIMVALGPGTRIRRKFASIASIASDSRYTISAALGVRDDDASAPAIFLGYTIRLRSGDTILAELASDIPPGPPNSVTTVGFSWDSSILPEGVEPGAPLAIEIAPNDAAGLEPGYLDLDNVRVTVVGE